MKEATLTVAGDSLISFLESKEPGGARIMVDPPPGSWAALKPAIRNLLLRLGRGESRTVFVRYPLCAIGSEWRQLPVEPDPGKAAPLECEGCGRRSECSPPRNWHRDLQPFGSSDPLVNWDAFHSRLCATLALSRRRELDDLVEAHFEHRPDVLAEAPYTIEPSLIATDSGLEPSVRMVVFHGPAPREASRARAHIEGLLESLTGMHRILGRELPKSLADIVREVGPCRFPIGFESSKDEPVRLKVYIEEPEAGGPALQMVAERVGRLIRGAPLCLPEHLDWSRVGMVGIGLSESGPDSFKAYVRSNPVTEGVGVEIPSLPPDSRLVLLSGQRAYLVLDLAHTKKRPPKWDLPVREHLLPNRSIPGFAPRGEAVAQLESVLVHSRFRCDLVAVGVRGTSRALYFELV